MKNFILFSLVVSLSACGDEPVAASHDATIDVDEADSTPDVAQVHDAAVDVVDAADGNDLGR